MTEREGVASVRIDAAGRSTEVAPIVLAIYDAHHRELASFIRGIERDPRVAEDVLSETFVRLIEELRRGRMPEQPRAWLYRVAANLVVDGGRHRTVVGRVLGRLVDHRTEPPPDDEILRGETAARGLDGARHPAHRRPDGAPARRARLQRPRGRPGARPHGTGHPLAHLPRPTAPPGAARRTRGDAMIDHAAARTSFATSLDFALEPDEREALDAHLRDCAACRSFAASLRNDSAVLRDLDFGPVPIAVRANIAIAAERDRRGGAVGRGIAPRRRRCAAARRDRRRRPRRRRRTPGHGRSGPDGMAANDQISWKTDVVSLTAREFSIVAGGKTFRAATPKVDVQSDPGDATYRTLEATWQENGVEMRLNLYFGGDATAWWVDEVRIYNGAHRRRVALRQGDLLQDAARGGVGRRPGHRHDRPRRRGWDAGGVHLGGLTLAAGRSTA